MTIKRFQAANRMSQAVVAGGLVHVAGQVADTRKARIEDQTRDVLGKIDALQTQAGTESRSSWPSTCSCPTSPASTR